MKLLSQSEFAKRQGWSRQYVGKLVRSGKITLVNGKIDPEQAQAAIKAQSEPSTELRVKPQTDTAFTTAHRFTTGGGFRHCPHHARSLQSQNG